MEWPVLTWLSDLRGRLGRVLLIWMVGTAVAWGFKEEIFRFLLWPATKALGDLGSLQAIAPTEIFFTYLKASLLAGFGIALPVFFWQGLKSFFQCHQGGSQHCNRGL